MEILRQIIRRKSAIFLAYSIAYLVVVALARWIFAPSWDIAWFMGGGLLGVYFLDAAELFFALSPSPFRSIVFLTLFVIVGFFVVSSGGSVFASALVLSLYAQLLFWQAGQWRLTGTLSSWYSMVAGPVPLLVQRNILIGLVVLFMFLTYIFIRA